MNNRRHVRRGQKYIHTSWALNSSSLYVHHKIKRFTVTHHHLNSLPRYNLQPTTMSESVALKGTKEPFFLDDISLADCQLDSQLLHTSPHLSLLPTLHQQARTFV